MAASRLLGDTDVLGGGGKNTGFVIESVGDAPVAIRMVKIDPGESFNFHGEQNQFMQSFNRKFKGNKLIDQRDLQFGNMQPKVIQWEKLLVRQKQRFLRTLNRGYEALKNIKLLSFLINRRGMFDAAITGTRKLLREDMVSEFLGSWIEYMDDQMEAGVYGDAVEALPAQQLADPQQAVAFTPKDIGAAHVTLKQAHILCT